MRINLVANVLREDAIESATRAVQWLRHRNIEVGADEELAQLLGIETLPPDQVAICDLVVSFGGDGTLIKTAHLCSERGTPILGVYFGRFGFVTQCKPAELGVCLSEFIDGKAKLEERMMLQAELVRGDKIVTTLHALNEIALQRMISARMLFFSIAIDGKAMTRYPADGIIVSTPTGSTAYNLSAGGPILDPNFSAIVISALAPHTLSARPLVLRPDAEIGLTVETQGDAVFSADSQTRMHLLSGDSLLIKRSPRVARLMSVDSDDFLLKLGERLFWSQSIVGGYQ